MSVLRDLHFILLFLILNVGTLSGTNENVRTQMPSVKMWFNKLNEIMFLILSPF